MLGVKAAAIAVLLAVVLAGCGSTKDRHALQSGPFEAVTTNKSARVEIRVAPNRTEMPNRFRVHVTRDGGPLRGARVVTRLTMLGMQMGSPSFALDETAPGVYAGSVPALVMRGRWRLSFTIAPRGPSAPFTVRVVDDAAE